MIPEEFLFLTSQTLALAITGGNYLKARKYPPFSELAVTKGLIRKLGKSITLFARSTTCHFRFSYKALKNFLRLPLRILLSHKERCRAMELNTKEKIITLAALNDYMRSLESKLNSGELDEDENADIANDATLLEILIARFEEEVRK